MKYGYDGCLSAAFRFWQGAYNQSIDDNQANVGYLLEYLTDAMLQAQGQRKLAIITAIDLIRSFKKSDDLKDYQWLFDQLIELFRQVSPKKLAPLESMKRQFGF